MNYEHGQNILTDLEIKNLFNFLPLLYHFIKLHTNYYSNITKHKFWK